MIGEFWDVSIVEMLKSTVMLKLSLLLRKK